MKLNKEHITDEVFEELYKIGFNSKDTTIENVNNWLSLNVNTYLEINDRTPEKWCAHIKTNTGFGGYNIWGTEHFMSQYDVIMLAFKRIVKEILYVGLPNTYNDRKEIRECNF